jgi:hypothetical protein
MSDKVIQQAKFYQDYYRYKMNEAKMYLECFIFGGIESDLEEAMKCARTAKAHRAEFQRLTEIELIDEKP